VIDTAQGMVLAAVATAAGAWLAARQSSKAERLEAERAAEADERRSEGEVLDRVRSHMEGLVVRLEAENARLASLIERLNEHIAARDRTIAALDSNLRRCEAELARRPPRNGGGKYPRAGSA
jgi:hypothetical protein